MGQLDSTCRAPPRRGLVRLHGGGDFLDVAVQVEFEKAKA
jgi:hypothetical protein